MSALSPLRVRARPRHVALLVVVLVLVAAVLVPLVRAGGHDQASGDESTSSTVPPRPQPNIVLISTDDMAVQDLQWMPEVRHLLGAEGTSFDRALSPHPLCCPARAAILTGQYAQNNGVKSNQPPYDFQALDNTTTMPVSLDRAGYQTAFTGKYLNGFGSHGLPQPGWDYWDPTMMGQYAYTPFVMYNDGHPRWYRHINNADYINQRVDTLVDQFSRSDQPFFIWASQVAPHGRIDKQHGIAATAKAFPPKRYSHLFATTQSPSLSDPGYRERDVSDKNSYVREQRKPSADQVNIIFRSRIRALQAVDQGVRQLIQHLRADGELANTYIMFTSDNGFLLGQHHLVTKNVPYSQAVRVPLVIRGPGIPAGQTLDSRALMIDLAPTIEDVAGATPLVKVDGVSLMPAMLSGAPLRDTVLIQAGPEKRVVDSGRGWWWRGVTTGRYTYADFYGDKLEELYDRAVDPAENINVAGDPAYATIVAELRRRTELLGDCAGADQCSRYFPPVPAPDTAREDGTLTRNVDPR